MRQLYNVSFADSDDCSELKLYLSEYGVEKRWVLWEWAPTDSASLIVDVPIATAPEGWEIVTDAPRAVGQAYLKALHRPVAGRIEEHSRRVMMRLDAPIDSHKWFTKGSFPLFLTSHTSPTVREAAVSRKGGRKLHRTDPWRV